MLQVRTSQVATLASARSVSFNESMVQHLRQHFAAATAPFDDHQLDALVAGEQLGHRRIDRRVDRDVHAGAVLKHQLAQQLGGGNADGLGQAAANPLLSVIKHFPEDIR